MTFISPNKAENIGIETAGAFIDKLNRLGFRFSSLYLDEDDTGPMASAATLVSEVPELDPAGKYNVIAFAGGDWHNVAQLHRQFGAGTLQDFKEVHADVYRGHNPDLALLNIPGAAKAIEKLIEKA